MAGAVEIGLCQPKYYSGFCPFLNWWKVAGTPTIGTGGGPLSGKAIWDAGTYFDSNGDIIANAGVTSIARLFFAVPTSTYQIADGCDFSSESWVVEWTGTATASISTGNVSSSSLTANKLTFTMQNPASTAYVLTLTVTNQNDPPKNIKIYQARYATNVANGEKFNPDWLTEVRKFGVLRFMNWQTTNNTDIVNFSQLADESYYAWCKDFGDGTQQSVTQFGSKGGLHPSLICQLANLTGCRIHVCLPLRCTDAFVTSFATYMRDNTTSVVDYEYSNETWNPGFQHYAYCRTQGDIKFAGDGLDTFVHGWKWYGYRSSQIMNIIAGIYNDGSRWKGILNAQAVVSTVASRQAQGFTYWKSEVSSSYNLSDFFNFCVAPYLGYLTTYLTGQPVSGISKTNPARVYSPAHGLSNGTRRKIIIQTGPTSINATFVTVANATTDYYDLSGVDLSAASGYAADTTLSAGAAANATSITVTSATGIVASGSKIGILMDSGEYFWTTTTTVVSNTIGLASAITGAAASGKRVLAYSSTAGLNFTTRPEFFDLCDKSNTLHGSNPTTYPTKYTYFNQQAKKLALTGSCDEPLTTSPSLADYTGSYFPSYQTLANSYGAGLRQYEGGYHLVGDGYVTSFGGVAQFIEYLYASAYSQEISEAFIAMFQASRSFGFSYPAKFEESGSVSQYGCWAGIRYWPLTANSNATDTSNPCWQVVTVYNQNKRRFKVVAS